MGLVYMTKGYSYLELIIFLFVSGIIARSALPYKSNKVFLKQEVEKLSTIMQELSNQALISGYQHQLLYQEKSNTFFAIKELGDTLQISEAYKLPREVSIIKFKFANIENSKLEINFYPSASSTPGTIIFQTIDQNCTLKQNIRGLKTVICY